MWPTLAYSTHNRAGEITVRQISELTFEVTVKTFTYTLSKADRPELPVLWGDNTNYDILPRISASLIEPHEEHYQLNIYKGIHTYPGPGIYEVVMEDPNRNYGVVNIPNSVNIVFSISTVIMVSPELKQNSTPVLLSNPIDRAAKGHIFIHNPAAFDPDGDSISYTLAVCRGEDGIPIENYTLPKSSFRPIYIDPVSGNLVWDSPTRVGIYNIAINVEEFRDGVKIGNILRDMQINVDSTDNNPPVNDSLNNYCITAGDTLYFEARSTDADLDRMGHEFIGGPFLLKNPPVIKKIYDTNGVIISSFNWKTSPENIRRLPYNFILKTKDVIVNDISLVDIDNFFITVIGPAPENLVAESSNTEINLNWEVDSSNTNIGYRIYRKIGQSSDTQDTCETGVIGLSGFEFIDEVTGKYITYYTDNNNGKGLAQGIEYCYVVVAEYSDGALSKASNKTCAVLLPGSPPLMNVSITNIDENNGSAYISWIKPRHLDTIPANGPYEIIISKSDDLKGNNMNTIYSFTSDSLNDTTYNDLNFNTINFPYSYKVEIYNTSPNRFLIGNPETASSLYAEIVPGDNENKLIFQKNIPWLNNEYVIFRENKTSGTFDSIGFTSNDIYIDENLNNGTEYCYIVKSKGWRMIDSVIFKNENWSHKSCGTPLDIFPPCAPELNVHTICDSLTNLLQWNDLNKSCANDVVNYKIFYSNTIDSELKEIATINNPIDTFFYHFSQYGPAGCYAVSAVDSFNNESVLSVKVCVDECSGYELPNVFTPNNDNINDIYKAINPNNYVKTVNMKIFNRWGMLVYETNDPDINWDGRYYKNNQTVSTGVYFYTCEVFENRLVGTVSRNLVGFIHVYTKKSKSSSTTEF